MLQSTYRLVRNLFPLDLSIDLNSGVHLEIDIYETCYCLLTVPAFASTDSGLMGKQKYRWSIFASGYHLGSPARLFQARGPSRFDGVELLCYLASK